MPSSNERVNGGSEQPSGGFPPNERLPLSARLAPFLPHHACNGAVTGTIVTQLPCAIGRDLRSTSRAGACSSCSGSSSSIDERRQDANERAALLVVVRAHSALIAAKCSPQGSQTKSKEPSNSGATTDAATATAATAATAAAVGERVGGNRRAAALRRAVELYARIRCRG